MFSYLSGRTCRICGAHITDNNPDGIGYTCREVWNHATNSAFYHFEGLNVHIAKANFWAKLFVKTFANTKFRSEFKKGFFTTIKAMVEKNEIRLSTKMLNIITEQLIGSSMSQYPPKFTYLESAQAKQDLEFIIGAMKDKWLSNLTTEQREYISNLAKKFYAEKSRR